MLEKKIELSMDLTQKCGGKGAKAVGMMGTGAKSL